MEITWCDGGVIAPSESSTYPPTLLGQTPRQRSGLFSGFWVSKPPTISRCSCINAGVFRHKQAHARHPSNDENVFVDLHPTIEAKAISEERG